MINKKKIQKRRYKQLNMKNLKFKVNYTNKSNKFQLNMISFKKNKNIKFQIWRRKMKLQPKKTKLLKKN